MTHDELLALIDECEDFAAMKGATTEVYPALRAVMELHYEHIGGAENAIYCYQCSVHYPCSTIQAIEKELA
jgi:hypothetical protein